MRNPCMCQFANETIFIIIQSQTNKLKLSNEQLVEIETILMNKKIREHILLRGEKVIVLGKLINKFQTSAYPLSNC